jgi:hypothetical protein
MSRVIGIALLLGLLLARLSASPVHAPVVDDAAPALASLDAADTPRTGHLPAAHLPVGNLLAGNVPTRDAVERTRKSGSDSGTSISSILINPVRPIAPASTLPTGNRFDRTEGYDFIFRLRSQMGLPPLAVSPRIEAAATGHSRYLALNELSSHNQRASDPHFTGVDACARMASAGFPAPPCGEVTSNTMTLWSGVVNLFDAPFHRFAYLDASWSELGMGAWPFVSNALNSRTTTTINFGGQSNEPPSDARLVVFPYPGQTDAPTHWEVNEEPNPAPDLAFQVVGYPMTIQSPEGTLLRISHLRVVDANGAPVTGRLIDEIPATRQRLRNTAIWLPMAPLAAGSRYAVELVGAVDGRGVVMEWSFQTLQPTALRLDVNTPRLLPNGSVIAQSSNGTGRTRLHIAQYSLGALQGGVVQAQWLNDETLRVVRNGAACAGCVIELQASDVSGQVVRQTIELP